MRFLVCIFVLFTASRALADGGVVVLREETGDMIITVFANPTPLRVGAVDLGVLAQDRATRQPLPDPDVRISLTSEENVVPPAEWATICNSLNGLGTVATATRNHSTNRLLNSAWLGVPAPGKWNLEVRVRVDGQSERVSQTLEVLPAAAPLSAWWPLIALVPIGIAGFALRGFFLRQRRRHRSLV